MLPVAAVRGPVVRAVGADPKIRRCVPRALVWDNESAVGKWRAGKPELTAAMNAFRGMLGIKVVLCRPADPEAKGLVERANGYLETSFLPGRSFTSPSDFNKLANHVVSGFRTREAIAVWDAARWTGGPLTPPRCWHCHPPRQWWVGPPRYDWAETITCGWTPTTTRCTPARSAVKSRLPPTWKQSGCIATPCWSVNIAAAGPSIKRSAIHSTWRAADELRARRRLATTAPSDETAVAYRDLADYDRILGIDGEVAS